MRNMRNDQAWTVFQQINEWIRFADVKATALLAVGGVLGGLLVSSAPIATDCAGCEVRQTLFGLAVTTVVLSTVMSLLVLLPRLGQPGQSASLIYFDHVVRRFARDRDGFVTAFTAAADDAAVMSREIAAQIWANSQVARRKYQGLRYATWLIGVAMVLAGTSALIPQP